MSVTLPAVGDNNWGTTLNTAVSGVDARVTALEAKSVAVPSSSTSTGTAGQSSYDASYLYVCVATNTWKRVAWTAGTW